MLFTRKLLVTELQRNSIAEMRPIEVVEFGNDDFESPCSEQSIWAFRGLKQDYENGLAFWIKTLQSQDWNGRESYFIPYAELGLCKSISPVEFKDILTEYSHSLRHMLPPFLGELDGFRSGLKMYAEWNDVAAVAETNDSFVAFYWSTTA